MSIYLSIDLSVNFFASPAAAGFVCYSAAFLLSAISQYTFYRWEEVVGPVTQIVGKWGFASHTVSAITDLIAVVQSEVDRLSVTHL